LRAERVTNALKLAATHVERGDHGRMRHALWQSLPFCWRYPRWWLSGGKMLLRAHSPRRLLEFYRQRRRGA